MRGAILASKMLSYRSMKPNKSIKDNIAQQTSQKQGWTTTAPVVDENLPPSKTRLKEEADAQQALGVRLCELPKDKLLKLDLPEALYEAVIESKKNHGKWCDSSP